MLLIGSGGREHALARALRQDSSLDRLLVIPGNPGTAELGTNVEIDPLDADAVVDIALRERVELAVIGPEAPLVAGVGEALRQAGVPVFGPDAEAAQLEGSKAFAKEIMAEANVPTARALVCTDMAAVHAALDELGAPHVVKDDGLAAGKGVVVTTDRDEAAQHAEDCLSKPDGRVLVEEFLDGPEVSLFCVCDGKVAVPLLPAQDFKRARNDGQGPNTGGMGAYCPLEWVPDSLVDEVVRTVAQPVVDRMAERGTPFVGLLYCGLALTNSGVRVVEFNVRFGDPETQVVLPLLQTSLLQVLLAAAQGRLDDLGPLQWRDEAAVTVVLAAYGYPGTVRSGDTLTGLVAAEAVPGVHVIHAGTTTDEDAELVSAGGRVVSVTAVADTVQDAREAAYQAIEQISLEGSHYRTDIARDYGTSRPMN